MNFEETIALADKLMTKHGISEKWVFHFDNAKRRLGKCNYSKKIISLSKHMIPLLERHEVEDTLLHEIAHALVGKGHGHGMVWKAKAIEIGCNGERLYCGEARTKPKYKGTCPKCGKVITRHRRKNISCGTCSRVFDKNLIFVWTINK